MRLLLDTHAWLWFVLGNASLSAPARELIEDANNQKLISPASYWEVAIKVALGKFSLPIRYDDFIQHAIADQNFGILHILPAHTSLLSAMPAHHRDPFDRLLVSQALVEKLSLISNDVALDAYGVHRLW
jgi:PIN domain nuclease of toxin-antitoxin system